jgi:hypothetical protein
MYLALTIMTVWTVTLKEMQVKIPTLAQRTRTDGAPGVFFLISLSCENKRIF